MFHVDFCVTLDSRDPCVANVLFPSVGGVFETTHPRCIVWSPPDEFKSRRDHKFLTGFAMI